MITHYYIFLIIIMAIVITVIIITSAEQAMFSHSVSVSVRLPLCAWICTIFGEDVGYGTTKKWFTFHPNAANWAGHWDLHLSGRISPKV